MKNTHRIIRFLYSLLFIALWLAIMYYVFGFTTAIYDSGSSIPSGAQIVPYSNHGHVVYITMTQHLLKELYGMGIMLALPVYLIVGVVLQAVYNVPIFRTDVLWRRSSKADDARPKS